MIKNCPAIRSKGLTAVEMIVVVGILGTAIFLTRVGMSFFNGLLKQQSLLETQRQTQTIIYNIGREVRMAEKILELKGNPDPAFLQMAVRDTGTFGYPTFNPKGEITAEARDRMSKLFSPIAIGTVTYQFRDVGNETYLERKAEYRRNLANPNDDVVHIDKLLVNLIENPSTPGAEYDIFSGDINTKVRLEFHLRPPFLAKSAEPRVYVMEAMRRRSH